MDPHHSVYENSKNTISNLQQVNLNLRTVHTRIRCAGICLDNNLKNAESVTRSEIKLHGSTCERQAIDLNGTKNS